MDPPKRNHSQSPDRRAHDRPIVQRMGTLSVRKRSQSADASPESPRKRQNTELSPQSKTAQTSPLQAPRLTLDDERNDPEEASALTTPEIPKTKPPVFTFASIAKSTGQLSADSKASGFGALAAKATTTNIFSSATGSPGDERPSKSLVCESEPETSSAGSTEPLAPISVITGEEDEQTAYTLTRAKLFVVVDGVPKEKGIGMIKVNTTPGYSRILMRSEGVHQVLANLRLYPNMSCKVINERVVYYVALIESKLVPHMFRCATAMQANELCDAISAHVPATPPQDE